MKRVVVIDCERTEFSITKVLNNHGSLSVKRLRELLESYDDDSEVVLSFDNGYTYGHLRETSLSEEIMDD